MDHKNYDYVELTLPNIKAELQKGVTADLVNVRINGKLATLVERLAKARPDWTIVAGTELCRGAHVTVQKVRVFLGKEELGQISLHPSRDGNPYVLNNSRIEKERRRGTGVISGDIGKAFKLALTKFDPKSVVERFEVVTNRSRIILAGVQSREYSNVRAGQNILKGEFEELLDRDWASVKAFMEGKIDSTSQSWLDGYPEAVERKSEAAALYDAEDTKQTVHIIITDGDYHVKKLATDEIELYNTNNLPEWMKRSIGMLKLLGDEEILTDTGLKIDENTYVILDTSPKEEENA